MIWWQGAKSPKMMAPCGACHLGRLRAFKGGRESLIADSSIFDDARAIDTMLVAGTSDYALAYASADVHAWLRRRAPKTRRNHGVAFDAFMLAEMDRPVSTRIEAAAQKTHSGTYEVHQHPSADLRWGRQTRDNHSSPHRQQPGLISDLDHARYFETWLSIVLAEHCPVQRKTTSAVDDHDHTPHDLLFGRSGSRHAHMHDVQLISDSIVPGCC